MPRNNLSSRPERSVASGVEGPALSREESKPGELRPPGRERPGLRGSCCNYPWNSLQIIRYLHIIPASQQASYVIRNRAADLHYQPASGLERVTGLRDQA